MRHQVSGFKTGGGKDRRAGMRKTLIKQLFDHERIKTTKTRALAIRGDAERLITLARNSAQGNDLAKIHARRLAAARLGDPQLVKKLFDDIAPRFANRNGGYTRISRLGLRQGDSAEMVLLELVE